MATSIFNRLQAENQQTQNLPIGGEADVIQSGSTALESGAYAAKILAAFYGESSGGAASLNLRVALQDKAGDYRFTLWITSGKAKGCKTYYETKNGDRNYLPGYMRANSLAQIITNKPITELEPTPKIVDVYNPATSKNEPVEVEMLMDLVGQEVILGLIKKISFKQKKDDFGNYVQTEDIRTENELDRIFSIDGFTASEISMGAKTPEFLNSWVAHNKGRVIDQTKDGLKAPSGASAGPSKASTTSTPETKRTSLFG